MNSTVKSVFFNSQSLLNDLEGAFEGSVLITQSTVLPSRASTMPDDLQPRMVSYRDAMVMFKLLTASESFDDGIEITYIYISRMSYSSNDRHWLKFTHFLHGIKNPRVLGSIMIYIHEAHPWGQCKALFKFVPGKPVRVQAPSFRRARLWRFFCFLRTSSNQAKVRQ